MIKCNECGSSNVSLKKIEHSGSGKMYELICNDCGNVNKQKVFKG